jgi:ribonuclease VapC
VTRYVFDSYALLAVYRDEPGCSHVDRLIENPVHERWMTAVNLGEVYYGIAKREGIQLAEESLDWLLTLPIELVEPTLTLSLDAARLKGQYALSYADCFAAALAMRLGASVVTGDPEFEQLERARIIDVEWLTRKPKRRRR